MSHVPECLFSRRERRVPQKISKHVAQSSSGFRSEIWRKRWSSNRRLAEPMRGLGQLHRYNWRGSAASEAFERALELSPNDPDVLINFALFLANIGEIDRALSLARRVVELDPYLGEAHATLGEMLSVAGDLESAIESYIRAAELGAEYVHVLIALTETALDNPENAARQALLSEPFTMTTESPQWIANLVYVYARINRPDDTVRALGRFDELASAQRVPTSGQVMVHLARGEKEEALRTLTKAAEEREPYEAFNQMMSVANNLYRDPTLDEPEFVTIREQIGFSDL